MELLDCLRMSGKVSYSFPITNGSTISELQPQHSEVGADSSVYAWSVACRASTNIGIDIIVLSRRGLLDGPHLLVREVYR